jgi:ABC-type multidrug transport system ATPase subunit
MSERIVEYGEEVSPVPGAPRVEPQPFIEADHLSLRGLRGYVYEDVTFSLPRHQLMMICGERGSGKSSLLLTLAGRMIPTGGSLTVAGYKTHGQRKKIAQISDMGIFTGLNEPGKNLKCRSLLSAQLSLHGKPHKAADLDAYLRRWRLEGKALTPVHDLSQPEWVLFGIALGMCSDPELLVVDNLEDQLTRKQTDDLIDVLLEIAHDKHTTIVASCTEHSLTARADQAYMLERR